MAAPSFATLQSMRTGPVVRKREDLSKEAGNTFFKTMTPDDLLREVRRCSLA